MVRNLASIELPSGMSLQRGHANAGECLLRRRILAADRLGLPTLGALQAARQKTLLWFAE
jgi:hypothetical protein